MVAYTPVILACPPGRWAAETGELPEDCGPGLCSRDTHIKQGKGGDLKLTSVPIFMLCTHALFHTQIHA